MPLYRIRHSTTLMDFLSLVRNIEWCDRLLATSCINFLYPAGTVSLALQLPTFELSKPNSVISRSWLRTKSYRYYSSQACAQNLWAPCRDTPRIPHSPPYDATALLDGLGLSKGVKSSEVWEKFKKLNHDGQKKFRKYTMGYLHHSTHESMTLRIIELFDELEYCERDSEAYEFAIQAYLEQKDLTKAIQLYNSASSHLEFPVGCDQILHYTINRNMWLEAYNVWRAEKSLYNDFNFYRFVGDSPPTFYMALSLARWVNETQNISQSPDLMRFSINLIEKAFLRSKPSSEKLTFSLLRSISEWIPLKREIYTNIITWLFTTQQHDLLLKCYGVLRLNKNYSLSQTALLNILQVSCKFKNMLYMKQVLDDFFSLHTKPSRPAYRICLKEFSRQGDANTVHALFKQYVNRYKNNSIESLQKTRFEVSMRAKSDKSGRAYFFEEIDEAAPLTANDFAPLLHVHAKRGEVEELEKIFEQMKTSFAVEPDILCWNIRLSAYVKIKETEKAYKCFEEILDNPKLKIDHYTFGTMMALYTSRADLVRAKDICKLAKDMDIPVSAVMINCLVLCLVRNEEYSDAEAVCRNFATTELIGSKTEMWNSLAMGYVLNRDLSNVNRILRLMSDNNIEYNNNTYSALMQGLVMTRQPYLAAKVLFEVMPKSKKKPTIFNYAVLLGGYLSIKDWKSFYDLYQKILDSNFRSNASTKLLAMKAAVYEDTELFENRTESDKFVRSFKIFSELMASMDPQDISNTARKGFGQAPLDVMYPAMFYSYMAYILSQSGEYKLSLGLLKEYDSWVPDKRKKAGQTIKIISAMMSSWHVAMNNDGVEECWENAVKLAREESKSLPPLPKTRYSDTLHEECNTRYNQLILNEPFGIYMKNLMAQKKAKELNQTVQDLISYGFELNNHNWNEYIKNLARNSLYYKLAFQVCEAKLMPGWQGWRMQRRKLTGRRSNIPLEFRRVKKDPKNFRPYFDTMLWLTRRMIDLRAKATEDPEIQKLINLLRHEYPKTIQAIDLIPRSDDESILKSDESQFEL